MQNEKTNQLREIFVTFKNGGKNNAPFSMSTNMAAHLTDEEMLNYYAVGKKFNFGGAGFDNMCEVESAEIIK